MDPNTLQVAEVTSPIYWRAAFDSLATVSELVEFIVLDIEPSGTTRGKFVLADAQVAPANAFQSNGPGHHGVEDGMEVDGGTDAIYHTRTHLGGVLAPGDTVLGYFLTRNNFNSESFDSLDTGRIPDVILVKKTYPNRRKKTRTRNWKLKSIAKEAEDVEETPEKDTKGAGKGAGRGALGRRGGLDQARVEKDYEMFLRDLEEDPELRSTVNLYKSDTTMAAPSAAANGSKRGGKGKAAFAMDTDAAPGGQASSAPEPVDKDDEEDAEDDFPEIKVDELLEAMDDLAIEDPAPQEGAEEE